MTTFPVVKLPTQAFISKPSNSKKQRRNGRATWNDSYEFVWLDLPQRCVKLVLQNGKTRQMAECAFKIKFQYRDQFGKLHSKTVKFGDQTDYVFSGDLKKRSFKFTHLSHQNDPFHPNYWRLHLLNTHPDIVKAHAAFVAQVMNKKSLID